MFLFIYHADNGADCVRSYHRMIIYLLKRVWKTWPRHY